jgi:hypothetical protein
LRPTPEVNDVLVGLISTSTGTADAARVAPANVINDPGVPV